jgi:hypothetical protein
VFNVRWDTCVFPPLSIAFPKLALDVLVCPRTFRNKPFGSFLIDMHFLSDVTDGVGTSGAQQAPRSTGRHSATFARVLTTMIHLPEL